MYRHELVEVAQTAEAPQEKKKRVRDEQTLREWNGSVQPRRNVSEMFRLEVCASHMAKIM